MWSPSKRGRRWASCWKACRQTGRSVSCATRSSARSSPGSDGCWWGRSARRSPPASSWAPGWVRCWPSNGGAKGLELVVVPGPEGGERKRDLLIRPGRLADRMASAKPRPLLAPDTEASGPLAGLRGKLLGAGGRAGRQALPGRWQRPARGGGRRPGRRSLGPAVRARLAALRRGRCDALRALGADGRPRRGSADASSPAGRGLAGRGGRGRGEAGPGIAGLPQRARTETLGCVIIGRDVGTRRTIEPADSKAS